MADPNLRGGGGALFQVHRHQLARIKFCQSAIPEPHRDPGNELNVSAAVTILTFEASVLKNRDFRFAVEINQRKS